MTMEEYIKVFDPKDVSPKSVVFDIKKLNWINGMYIRKLSLADLSEKIKPFLPTDFPTQKLSLILPLIHERLETLADIESLTEFFFRPIVVSSELLLKKSDALEVTKQLEQTHQALASISEENWDTQTIETVIRDLAKLQYWYPSQYFMMLRIAATGNKATPPLFDTLCVVGKTALLERLLTAKATLTT